MQIHDVHLGQAADRSPKHRVGRGPSSGRGKTSGRGSNGFKSRSGNSVPAYYEGGQTPLYRRIPKRGFGNGRFRRRFTTMNIDVLNVFDEGSVIGPDEIVAKRIIRKITIDGLKFLGEGELKVKSEE